MVVRYFDFVSIAIAPLKANAPLIIDAQAVLAGAVTGQLFQTIAGRDAQIVELFGGIQDSQFVPCDSVQIGGKAP